MAANKKREVEHQFLARIDNTPASEGKPGMWDLVVAYAKHSDVSANDALNEMISMGLKRKKLL
ncbi:MAG: hypothetical protein E4G89_00360 [Methanothrix sp.]|nr:MAG: hypothetical protein E4G89_00360 [Methanothrix sp.]